MNEGETIELRPGKFTKTCVVKGGGNHPTDGHLVLVAYHGTLDDGTVFDTSRGRKPITFHLGRAEVIKGWDIAVATMTVGEKAIVHIPADYAYGKVATGPIPPNSDLTFELELLSSRDDTCSQLRWQLLGLVCVLAGIVIFAPMLNEGGQGVRFL